MGLAEFLNTFSTFNTTSNLLLSLSSVKNIDIHLKAKMFGYINYKMEVLVLNQPVLSQSPVQVLIREVQVRVQRGPSWT